MVLLRRNIIELLRNRHMVIIQKHITIKKIINIIRSMYLYQINHARLNSHPLYVKIETTDVCNLKCKNCHDGTVPRKNQFLDYSLYTKLIDHLKDYLIEVSLFDQGEPLMDPRIFDYIEYANKRNIGTVISTNFSMQLSDEKLFRLVDSGLDYMQIGIDGTTQKTYEKYRIGGNLATVFSNLERIIEIKKKLNTNTPVVEWQMVDYDSDRFEVDHAQRMGKSFGVDKFIVKQNCYASYPPGCYSRKSRCRLLWTTFAVECDGLVSACLAMDDESLYVGDLNSNSVTEIWNSEKFVAIRKGHINHKSDEKYFCGRCNRFDD